MCYVMAPLGSLAVCLFTANLPKALFIALQPLLQGDPTIWNQENCHLKPGLHLLHIIHLISSSFVFLRDEVEGNIEIQGKTKLFPEGTDIKCLVI